MDNVEKDNKLNKIFIILGQKQGEKQSGSRSFFKSADLSCRWIRYERQQGYGKRRRKGGSQLSAFS